MSGASGEPDGGILANSAFGRALGAGTLHLPADQPLPAAEHRGPQPHCFVADEAFPLRRNLMKPFPGHILPRDKMIFNYRLCRARLVVENAFSILAAQWRMYHRVLEVQPEVAEKCMKATCVFHNFLRMTAQTPGVGGIITGSEVEPLPGLGRVGVNNSAREAIRVRETFSAIFSTEGVVP